MRCHALFFLRPIPPALVLAAVLGWGPPATAEAPRPAVIAYVFPRDRVLESSEIRADKLTHVNFAFANVVGGRVVEGSPRDAENLRVLTGLRRDHPHLRILVSVGGWTWSKGFSDAALTAKSRRVFVASAVDFVRRHDLDGFDVDWEYPGLPGDGNPHRPEDKENFTALMADLRAALDREGARRGRPLLLTFAAGASREFLAHTEMAKVQAVVDFVNLMTYDFRVANPGAPAGHHANLYPSPADPRSHSADGAVKDFLAAGVPASKLVLGVPFYGRAWEGVSSPEGLYREGRPPSQRIDSSHPSLAALVGREGWVRAWDSAAQAPFLWNEARKAFVTYEDEESLRLKSRYVREKGLGGVMFWEYHADRTGALLDTLDAALRGTDVVPLSGVWRFALDPADEGLVAFWENRTLADRIRLPGVLQAQGFGNDVTVDTQWTGQIVDRSFFTAPRYEPYRQPGNVKVPVLAAARQALRGAGLVRARGRRPAGVEGPPRRPAPRAAALADDGLARRPGRRLERQPVDAARVRPRHGRTRDAPADDPGGQPPGRRRRPQLAQRHRPHAVQLERHRGPDGAAARERPCGSTTCRSTRRVASRSAVVRGPHRQRDGRGRAAGPCGSRCRRREGPALAAEGGGRVLGRGGRRVRGRAAARRGRSHLGRVLARALPADGHARGGRGPRHARGPLRPAGDRRPQGTQFVVNGRKIFLRGTLECCIFPLTGYPPTDVRRRGSGSSASAKAHGLNHIRFHSWCPPEAAFAAADELGFYYQVEMRVLGQPGEPPSATAGRSTSGSTREADRILKAYGNHPSFLLMAYGNEPAGRGRGVPRPLGRPLARRRTRAGSTPAAPAGR